MVVLRIRFLLISTLALNLVSSAKAATSSLLVATLPSPIPVINNEPNFTYDELYKLLTDFWDNFLYPADVTQAKSINSTILSGNVPGRIDATLTFTGRELNTEYLFSLFANLAATPSSLRLIGVPISYEILKFSGNEYVSSASTRVTLNISSFNLVVPIEIDTWNTWNSLGQMTQYDGIFKYWQWLQDYVVEQRTIPLSQSLVYRP
jgi:hypothetical protein